jgi:hypothetical protein
MIYVMPLGPNKCITHDGDVELGIFNFGVKKYKELVRKINRRNKTVPPVEVCEVHWKPDPHGSRYKRVNFQRHEKVAGKDALESFQTSNDRLSQFRKNRV